MNAYVTHKHSVFLVVECTSVRLLMFIMSVVIVGVALVPCKSYCYFYLLIQNGNIYTAAELSHKLIESGLT